MALINGYPLNSDITVMNTIYEFPHKDPETGKTEDDYMLIIYKDNKTGQKHHQFIYKPEFDFYKLKSEYYKDYNLFIAEKEKTEKITCRYRDLTKTIAEVTGNEEFFYSNIESGNYKNNQELHTLPNILFSDTNVEDRYRFMFDLDYQNNICPITKAYFDIEVDTIDMAGDFPEMGECPVNAISCIIEENNKLCVFLLRNQNNDLIQKFEDNINADLFNELKEFIIENVGGMSKAIKYGVDNLNIEFRFFDDEIKLIRDFFRFVNYNEPDFLLAWNMAFDIPYLFQRIINLGYLPSNIMCHKDFEKKVAKIFLDQRNADVFAERCDKYTITAYTVYLDQLIQFASRRKGQSAFKSMKLDDIGNVIAGVRKLDYSHITRDLSKLPYLDYKTFVFYNIMDTIVQKCIESKTGDIDYIFGKCVVNNTRYDKGHRQTVYLTNRGAKEFYNQGFIIGNNVNRHNDTIPYPGALVGNPRHNSDYLKLKQNGEILNIGDNMVDFDYKSLYPSIDRENNAAPNTQIGKLIIKDKIYKLENPFHSEFYYRGGKFMMDYASGNYLEFGKRWFNLASIRDFMEDCIEYFTRYRMAYYGNNIFSHVDENIEGVNPFFHDDDFNPFIRDSFDIDIPSYISKIGGYR